MKNNSAAAAEQAFDVFSRSNELVPKVLQKIGSAHETPEGIVVLLDAIPVNGRLLIASCRKKGGAPRQELIDECIEQVAATTVYRDKAGQVVPSPPPIDWKAPVKAKGGKFECPGCHGKFDATDGYASQHSFGLHFEQCRKVS